MRRYLRFCAVARGGAATRRRTVGSRVAAAAHFAAAHREASTKSVLGLDTNKTPANVPVP